jgi:hypothetical protein
MANEKPPQDLVRTIADVLRVRSGGHFEAVRDQTDEKFLDDARAIMHALQQAPAAAREEPQGGVDDREWMLSPMAVGVIVTHRTPDGRSVTGLGPSERQTITVVPKSRLAIEVARNILSPQSDDDQT